jgi:transcriptional regulator with XRE-family HTH domain
VQDGYPPGVPQVGLEERFGIVVRRLRKAEGLSQEDFADRCGLHRTYIGSIERGEKTVTIATATKVAEALGLRLWELLKQVDEEPRSRVGRRRP